MMESFWSTPLREMLDRHGWTSCEELASAIFEWIEGSADPLRHHSGPGYRSPNDFEDLHTAPVTWMGVSVMEVTLPASSWV